MKACTNFLHRIILILYRCFQYSNLLNESGRGLDTYLATIIARGGLIQASLPMLCAKHILWYTYIVVLH